MKNSHKCPKCNNSNICSPRLKSAAPQANYFQHIPLSTFKSAELIRYICLDCGYVEVYVENEKDLKLLKDKFGSI